LLRKIDTLWRGLHKYKSCYYILALYLGRSQSFFLWHPFSKLTPKTFPKSLLQNLFVMMSILGFLGSLGNNDVLTKWKKWIMSKWWLITNVFCKEVKISLHWFTPPPPLSVVGVSNNKLMHHWYWLNDLWMTLIILIIDVNTFNELTLLIPLLVLVDWWWWCDNDTNGLLKMHWLVMMIC
jgi:hypothetical protein